MAIGLIKWPFRSLPAMLTQFTRPSRPCLCTSFNLVYEWKQIEVLLTLTSHLDACKTSAALGRGQPDLATFGLRAVEGRGP